MIKHAEKYLKLVNSPYVRWRAHSRALIYPVFLVLCGRVDVDQAHAIRAYQYISIILRRIYPIYLFRFKWVVAQHQIEFYGFSQ